MNKIRNGRIFFGLIFIMFIIPFIVILVQNRIVTNFCPNNCTNTKCYIETDDYISTGKCTCSYNQNNSTIILCRDYTNSESYVKFPYNIILFIFGFILLLSGISFLRLMYESDHTHTHNSINDRLCNNLV